MFMLHKEPADREKKEPKWQKTTEAPRWDFWPENPPQWILLSLFRLVPESGFRSLVGNQVIFVCFLVASFDVARTQFLLLNTD
jgi:hypothetical protein